MANNLLTISKITNEALMVLENELTFTSEVDRNYDDQFAVVGGKIGNTVNVRRPGRFVGAVGPQLVVEDYKSIKRLVDQGSKDRAVASTLMNNRSSRSHAILTLYFTQIVQELDLGKSREIVSKINLVDLAGSERVEVSGVTGINFKEAININKSLSTLGLVISKLASKATISKPISNEIKVIKTIKKYGSLKKPTNAITMPDHIPFRDSVLTWILKESLGGNSKTYMLATISPSALHYNETLNTLRYAANAKQIINTVKINEDPNDKIIRILKNEIDLLREKLKTSSGTDVKQLRDELMQREELMKEKEKSWEQKLEEGRNMNKEAQEQIRQEMMLKQAEFKRKLETMNNEREILLNEMDQMKSSLSDKEVQKQKAIEDELSKAQKEFEQRQNEFEKGRLVETAVTLQEYYEKKLDLLKIQYEEKIAYMAKQEQRSNIDEIDKLRQHNLSLKETLSKNQCELQIQMRQFTTDRGVLTKQIQQLQSKIHSLEHDMQEARRNSTHNANDLEKKTQEYNIIRQKRDVEEQKYNLLQQEYKALDKRIENDKRELDELNKKHAQILREVDTSSNLLNSIKDEYALLRTKFEADKDEYNILLVKKEELHTEIVVMKANLDLHISKVKDQLKNPTIVDLTKIQEGFDLIFNNIKPINDT